MGSANQKTRGDATIAAKLAPGRRSLQMSLMTPYVPQTGFRLPPEMLVHRYAPEQDAVHFVAAERALRRSVPFLIDEYLPQAAEPIVVRRTDALSVAPPASTIHFIFHSAYCCSTLLANALDREGVASTLKEPVILNDLVGWRHRGGLPEKIGEVLDSSLTLLARPFEPAEAVVVKPSNVVNGLASAMMTIRPKAQALLLYAPLPIYLGSIAKKGLEGRRWVRDLLLKQLKERFITFGFEPEDYMLQTDLQVAAMGWLAQHRLFVSLTERWPERVRTLNSEVLLERPAEALEALGLLFGLKLPAAAVAEIIDQTFSRNAKSGETFRREDRLADQVSASAAHADEIAKVTIWAEAVAKSAGLSLKAPAPLLQD
jgi:hypothetical protein